MWLLDHLRKVLIEETAIVSTIGFTETEWSEQGKGYIGTITRMDSLIRIGTVTVIVVETEDITTTSMEGVARIEVVMTEVTTKKETSTVVTGGEETATTFHPATRINLRGRTTQVAEGEGWRVGVATVMGCLRGATAMVGVASGLVVVVEGGVGDIHLLVVDTVSQ